MTQEEIFAKTIFGEARGESLAGQEAVANVILNRVKYAQHHPHIWWGKTIQEVCLKPKQFSCWNKDDKNYRLLLENLNDNPLYQICLRVAKRAQAGLIPDNTHHATHYHSVDCSPVWARHLVPCAEIGRHLFYVLP